MSHNQPGQQILGDFDDSAAQAWLDECRTLAQLQQQLLPRDVPQPAGWQIAVHYKVSARPSGDYYDFLPLRDGCLEIVIADASGHAGPSAVLMAIARVTLHSCPLSSGRDRGPFCPLSATMKRPPHTVLGHLNEVVFENCLEGQFMTAFLGELNPFDRILTYANAGHPGPRWWQAATGTIQPAPDAGGIPLGLILHSRYDDGRLELAPGDSLVLYSDGLPEAMNKHGQMFGLDRLDMAIRDSARDGAEATKSMILDRLNAFMDGDDPQDDVTLLVVHRLPACHAPTLTAKPAIALDKRGLTENRCWIG